MMRSRRNMKDSGRDQDRMGGPCWEATGVAQARNYKSMKRDLAATWIRRVREEGKHKSPSRFLDCATERRQSQ